MNVQFDQELVGSASGILRSPLAGVQNWLQSTQPSESASAAVNAHREIVEALFPSLFSASSIRPYYERLAAFESLIRIAIGEIGGKFYRDHLAHAVRTFLIAARLVKNLDIPRETKDAIYLASLFHDVGYPLQEATHVLQQIAKSINETFRSLVVSQATAMYSDPGVLADFVEQLRAWSKLRGSFPPAFLDEEMTGVLLGATLGFNHGILSGYETWMSLNKEARQIPWVQDALLAISFHDNKVFQRVLGGKKLRCVARSSFPALFFLILSDELQEWNRPVFLEDKGIVYPLDKISQITSSKKGINAKLDYSSNICPGFSPLVQLADKVSSISRLDDCRGSVGLHFILPRLLYLSEVEVCGTPSHDLVVDFDPKRILADSQEVLSHKVKRFSLMFKPDDRNRVNISASYQQEYRTGHASGERTVEARIRLTLPEAISYQLSNALSVSRAILSYVNTQCMELVLLLQRTPGCGKKESISNAKIEITEGNCHLELDGVCYIVVCVLPRGNQGRLKLEGERTPDPRLAVGDKITEYNGNSIPTHSVVILKEEDRVASRSHSNRR